MEKALEVPHVVVVEKGKGNEVLCLGVKLLLLLAA